MAAPLTFTRVYVQHGEGLEHPATPQRVEAVLRSMAGAVSSSAPFNVRLRMDDGSVVMCRPKPGRAS